MTPPARELPPRQRSHDIHEIADADLVARPWVIVRALKANPRSAHLAGKIVMGILDIIEACAMNIDPLTLTR